jgi:CheY-like chemotaxis protein
MPSRKVLIVEDHAESCRALAGLMRRKGWEVQAASTIVEGLEGLRAQPDFVVLDLMLPDGDGEALMIKALSQEHAPHVVVCTGVSDPERLDVVWALGPDALLQKPIHADDLYRACGAVV